MGEVERGMQSGGMGWDGDGMDGMGWSRSGANVTTASNKLSPVMTAAGVGAGGSRLSYALRVPHSLSVHLCMLSGRRCKKSPMRDGRTNAKPRQRRWLAGADAASSLGGSGWFRKPPAAALRWIRGMRESWIARRIDAAVGPNQQKVAPPVEQRKTLNPVPFASGGPKASLAFFSTELHIVLHSIHSIYLTEQRCRMPRQNTTHYCF